MKQIFLISLSFLLSLGGLFGEALLKKGDRLAIVGNTLADQLRTHGYLETLLMEWSQPDAMVLRNLGWAGDTLTKRDRPTNFPTHRESLEKFKTDVILAFFGFGESFSGEAGLVGFKEDLKTYFQEHAGKSYNGKSEVRLILASPIAHENLGKLSPHFEKRQRELALYTQAMNEVCAENKIPFIDIYSPSKTLMAEQGMPKLTNNGIHLNDYGYWAMSHILLEKLVGARERAGMSINGKQQDAKNEINVSLKEQSWPSLTPPIQGKIHKSLHKYRDSLQVQNLQPGDYTLLIDGQPVASGSHKAWAKGKVVDRSPAHSELENYRLKVKDKNEQFIYSWKALNQVHIVGERRRSPSGMELPAEVIRFLEISEGKQLDLKKGMPLKKREYRLIPQVSEALLQ